MPELIFELSQSGRHAKAQTPGPVNEAPFIPVHLLRKDKPNLPEVSELQVVSHSPA